MSKQQLLPGPAFLPELTALIFQSIAELLMSKIQKIRNASFKAQNGVCYYCQQPMWRDHPDAFARQHLISVRQARFLQATAEHLRPRSEGGGNARTNIVAACFFCNSTRHKAKVPLPPAGHLKKVRARMAAGRWHRLHLGPACHLGEL